MYFCLERSTRCHCCCWLLFSARCSWFIFPNLLSTELMMYSWRSVFRSDTCSETDWTLSREFVRRRDQLSSSILIMVSSKCCLNLKCIYKVIIWNSIIDFDRVQMFNIEKKHKLLFCRTAKSGSSTWGHYFVDLYTDGWNESKHWSQINTFLRLFRTGKGVDFSKFIGRATTRLEKENISMDKKRSAVKELRSGDHAYTAFFVCRNPVEKMLSVWDHFRLVL